MCLLVSYQTVSSSKVKKPVVAAQGIARKCTCGTDARYHRAINDVKVASESLKKAKEAHKKELSTLKWNYEAEIKDLKVQLIKLQKTTDDLVCM